MWPFKSGYKLKSLPDDMRKALMGSPSYDGITDQEPLLCYRSGTGKQYTFSICSTRDQEHMLVEGRKNTEEPEKESTNGFIFSFYTGWKEKPPMSKKKK